MTRDECACVCSHCVHVCVFTSLHYGESISNHSSHTGHRFLSIGGDDIFLKIVFCSSISSWSIVGRLNKRLPVASDSPGVTDSYDAAVDSLDI